MGLSNCCICSGLRSFLHGCGRGAARGSVLVKDPDGGREEVPRRAALLLLTHSSLLPWHSALHLQLMCHAAPHWQQVCIAWEYHPSDDGSNTGA